MINGFAFLDVETTGLNPEENQIIEIAIHMTDMQLYPTGNYHEYVKLRDGQVLSQFIQELTGIDEGILERRGIEENLLRFYLSGWLRNRIIVSHNASFDLGFIAQYFKPKIFICTKALAYFLEPGKPTNLEAVCKRHGITMKRHHNALSDAIACKHVLKQLVDEYGFIPQYFNTIVEEPDRQLYYIPSNAQVIKGRVRREAV